MVLSIEERTAEIEYAKRILSDNSIGDNTMALALISKSEPLSFDEQLIISDALLNYYKINTRKKSSFFFDYEFFSKAYSRFLRSKEIDWVIVCKVIHEHLINDRAINSKSWRDFDKYRNI